MPGPIIYRQTAVIGVGASYVDVTLDHPFNDADYVVGVELTSFQNFYVMNQTSTGFRLVISTPSVYSTQPVGFLIYHE